MVNLKTQIPSETPGDVVTIQKGRAILSLNTDELQFLVNLAFLVTNTNIGTDVPPYPTATQAAGAVGSNRIIPITATSSDSVAA